MHGNKNMSYSEREGLLRAMQDRDLKKTQLAKDNGYQVFRIDVTNHLPTDWYDILVTQGWDIF